MAKEKKAEPKDIIKVYYPVNDAKHLRDEAKKNGFSNVQAYLKWLAHRRRTGQPT